MRYLGAPLAVALLLLGAAPAARGDNPRAALSGEGQRAFDLLRRAKVFEGEEVGEGGHLSRNAMAVRTLIREPAAPRAFQALYDAGPIVPRLYALAAFWYLRPDDYAKLVEEVRARDGKQEVDVLRGCKGVRLEVEYLLGDKAPKSPRLKPGTRAVDALCKPGTVPSGLAGGLEAIAIVEGATVRTADCRNPPPRPDYLKPRSGLRQP